MEIIEGGEMDYGDLTCEEFWAAASIAVGGASFYATALFGPFGALGAFIAGAATTIAGMNC